MKYLNKYENFKEDEDINEDLNALFASAKGAFKSFLNAFTAPFKNLSADFKKGLKKDEMKQKINTTLDTMLKAATENINKAEDETVVKNIKDAFTKELEDKIIEFDKEIKTIKESKLFESVIKDSMIGGRVLLGIIRDKSNELSADYDKKYSGAKDLNAQKSVTLEYIKNVIDQSKKILLDDKMIDDLTKKYMADNKITSTSGYKQGDTVIYLRQGKTKEQWDALPDEKKKDISSIEASAIVNAKRIEKIEGENVTFKDKDGKEFIKSVNDIIGKAGEGNTDVNKQLTDRLTQLKSDPEKIKKISSFADFMSKPENAAKVEDIEKIISGGNSSEA